MRGIELLHPELQKKARELQRLCSEKGLPLLITETWRTKAEQDALYAKGRTTAGSIVTNVKYPNSMHCWGVAFDFCRNVRGREYDDGDGFFGKVGALGKTLGLEWGGDWKSPIDKPHFQMREWAQNSGTGKLVSMFGTPDRFKATWAAVAPQKTEGDLVVETRAIDVNGRQHDFNVIMKDGATFVKLRDFERVGYQIGYEESTKRAEMNLMPELKCFGVNGDYMDVETVLLGGSNYIKLRELEKLGISVGYEGDYKRPILSLKM